MTKLIARLRLWMLALPIVLAMAGFALNQSVLVANGGKFPVMINAYRLEQWSKGDMDEDSPMAKILGVKPSKLPEGYMDEYHIPMTGDTKLNWLADYIDLHSHIVSPGDLLISVGEVLWTFIPISWATLLVNDLLGSNGQVRAHGQGQRSLS